MILTYLYIDMVGALISHHIYYFKPWFFSFEHESLYTSWEKEIIDTYWTRELFEWRLKEVNDGEGRDIRTGNCQVHHLFHKRKFEVT